MKIYECLFTFLFITFALLQMSYAAGKISAGIDYSLFVDDNGTVWAWGNNFSGKLGDGTITDTIVPKQVKNLENIKLVEAGCDESFAIDKNANLWVWGENLDNYLGISKNKKENPISTDIPECCNGPNDSVNTREVLAPEKFSELENKKIVNVSSSCHHTLIITSDFQVYGWGENFLGQLGNYSRENSFKPYLIKELDNSIDIATGSSFSFALKTNGDAFTCGSNKYGQLGIDFVPLPPSTDFFTMPLYSMINGLVNYNSRYSVVPTKTTKNNLISISAGNDHALVLDDNGNVWAWGRNNRGQLGNGKVCDNESTNKPVKVLRLEHIIAISAGGDYSLALDDNGTVWAWGDNTYEQLGNDDVWTNYCHTPVKVKDISDVKEISAGTYHALALKKDNTVWGWGRNNFGQLSGRTLKNVSTPTKIEFDASAQPFFPPMPAPGNPSIADPNYQKKEPSCHQ